MVGAPAAWMCALLSSYVPASKGLRAGALAPQATNRRSREVQLLELSQVAPFLVTASLAAGGLFLFADNEPEDLFDRTRASRLPAMPPAPPVAGTTPEGRALMAVISTDQLPSEWRAAVSTLGDEAAAAANAPDASSLQGRIAAVQALTQQRHALADMLAVHAAHKLIEPELSLLPSVASIAPGVALPPTAATLVRVAQQFPGQSARQVRAFVTESAPSNDPKMGGRFDRLQAAQLYMGMIQFGYFIAQIFRGQADLDDETTLTGEEARAVTARIQRATREMRCEVAWLAASRRAGVLLQLPQDEDASFGYEALREFTVGVQVVGAAQQSEFFAPSDEGRADAAGGGAMEKLKGAVASAVSAADAMPAADLVRFNAAGLQAMLAEGCLYGWHLWGAEAEAMDILADSDAEEALLVPPATPA